MTIIPPGETIVETKKCLISGETFHVTDKDLEFYDSVSPIFGGKKYSIPSPTLCPDERLRRRLCWRNERKLYHNKCSLSGNQVISTFSPEKKYQIYDQSIWWGDDWEPKKSAMSISLDTKFMTSFGDLLTQTPLLSLYSLYSENSEFQNFAGYNKDCYLVFNSLKNENCCYGKGMTKNQDCFDIYFSTESQNCYEIIDSHTCYRVFYSKNCKNCSNSSFLRNCSDCHNCFGCINQVGKSYMIFDKQFTEKNYFREMKEILAHHSINEIYQKFLARNIIEKCVANAGSENCFGDYLNNCSQCFQTFESNGCESCKFNDSIKLGKRSYDTVGNNIESEFLYECMATGRGSNMLFSIGSENCNFGMYNFYCQGSSNNFGCCSLKKASHCILNKPYSKHEYETLCGKIIDHMKSTGEWGEFFPHEMSPFGYNETVAQEYFPMTEDEVSAMPKFEHWRSGKYLEEKKASGSERVSEEIRGKSEGVRKNEETPGTLNSEPSTHGWNWRPEDETSSYHGEYYTPLGINSYDETKVGVSEAKRNIDSCIAGIHKCEVTEKPFKVIKQELAFYIENSIPIPTKCPDQRHKERMALRNPRKLYERKCMCPTCKTPDEPMYTTYAPDRPETVYCEECYRDEVYS